MPAGFRRHLVGKTLGIRYSKLYPQNGDRIVTIDSVTSFHTMYLLTYLLLLHHYTRLTASFPGQPR